MEVRRALLALVAAYGAAVLASRSAAPPPATAPADDDARLEAARAYLEALVSHDPSAVRLHPRATRREAGVYTALSGWQMRFEMHRGPQFRLGHAVENLSMTVDGAVVEADYEIDVRYLASRPWLRARVQETFTFDRDRPDLIRRIVAAISVQRPRR